MPSEVGAPLRISTSKEKKEKSRVFKCEKRREEKMSEKSSSGIGFVGLLQIVFIVLKLAHVIDWSWWIVFTPIWAEIGFFVLCIFIAWIVYGD